MPANTSPITIAQGNIGWTDAITTALNTYTGTTLVAANLIWTAGANGGFLERIRIQSLGTNVATLARFFLNNGSTPATAANNICLLEVSIPATAASALLPLPPWEIPVMGGGIVVNAGYRLYGCIATAVAAGVQFCAVGGDF